MRMFLMSDLEANGDCIFHGRETRQLDVVFRDVECVDPACTLRPRVETAFSVCILLAY